MLGELGGRNNVRVRPGSVDHRPWLEQHAIVRGFALTAAFLLVFVGVFVARTNRHYGVFILPAFMTTVYLAVFALVPARLTRRAAKLRQDSNVVWAGCARLDRIDVIRVGLTPEPPPEYGTRSTFVLITRTGIAVRPIKDRWGWAGAQIDASRISALCIGTARQGNRSMYALLLLVGQVVVTLPIYSTKRGLTEAIASTALASKMLDKAQFAHLIASIDATAADAAAERAARPIGSTRPSLSALRGRVLQNRGRSLKVCAALFFGGIVAIVTGIAIHLAALAVLGMIAVIGPTLLLSWLDAGAQLQELRNRKRLLRALDTDPAASPRTGM